MGAKDTFPSRLLSLTGANEVEPLVFFFLFKQTAAVLFLGAAAWCDPSAFMGKNKEDKRQLCKKQETLMIPLYSFERLSEHNTSTARRHERRRGRRRGRSYFMCMHVMNEYVFHVNCAHKAYCYGLAQTLHFFGHANMPTCNQQTGRDGERRSERLRGDLK